MARHIPERTCVGCYRKRPQAELLRFGKGRGAYLCPDSPACLETALKKNRFARALRRKLTSEEEKLLKQQLACQSSSGGYSNGAC